MKYSFKYKSESGITLTALVVSIIVMIILAAVTVSTSFTAYENTRAEKFKAQMKVIQETIDDSVYPDYEIWVAELQQSKTFNQFLQEKLGCNKTRTKFTNLGLNISNDEKNDIVNRVNSLSEVTDFEDLYFYTFNEDELNKYFGIKDMDLTVYINFDHRIVISAQPVKVDNKNIYTLYELDKDGSLYKFDAVSATNNGKIIIDEIANYGTSKRIKLTLNVDSAAKSNDIIKYKIRRAYYKISSSGAWLKVDDLKECKYSEDGMSVTFVVYEAGKYYFRIQDISGTATEAMYQYTQFNIKNKTANDTKNYTLVTDGYLVELCNKPVLTSDMVPIKWVYEDKNKASGSWVVCSSIDPEWYNYSKDNKMWANIMFKKDVSKDKGFEIGTEYKEGQTGSMFVWIPRFTCKNR